MSLLPIHLGDGQAPDVTIVDGVIYAAVPLRTVLHLDAFNAVGARVLTTPIADGFDASFPRFHREWLIYKSYPTWAPVVRNLRTGETRTFTGHTVDGGCFVDADRQLAVWETAQPGGLLRIFAGSLLTGAVMQTALLGAPDGIERFNPDGSILCRKDIALEDPAVGGFPSHAGDLTVGQYGYGIGVRLANEPVRWMLAGSETMWPRCARDGRTNAIISWGNVGVRLVIATDEELRMLPFTVAGPDAGTPPDPVKPPPTKEPDPMPVPDHSAFARDFLGPRLALVGSFDETRAHTFAAVKAGAAALHTSDPRVGLLAKTSGDNVDGFAADIWLMDLGNGTAQVVDVVNNGEGAPNAQGVRTAPTPSWDVKDIRPISQWRAPSADSAQPGDGGPIPPSVDASFAGAASAIERRIAALEAKDAAQAAEIAALKARPIGGGSVSLDGLRITLRTDDGSLVTAEDGGGGDITAVSVTVDEHGRIVPRPFGGWQIFRVEVQ